MKLVNTIVLYVILHLLGSGGGLFAADTLQFESIAIHPALGQIAATHCGSVLYLDPSIGKLCRIDVGDVELDSIYSFESEPVYTIYSSTQFDEILVGGYNTLWVSNDCGESWERIDLPPRVPGGFVNAIAEDVEGRLYINTGTRILHTEDRIEWDSLCIDWTYYSKTFSVWDQENAVLGYDLLRKIVAVIDGECDKRLGVELEGGEMVAGMVNYSSRLDVSVFMKDGFIYTSKDGGYSWDFFREFPSETEYCKLNNSLVAALTYRNRFDVETLWLSWDNFASKRGIFTDYLGTSPTQVLLDRKGVVWVLSRRSTEFYISYSKENLLGVVSAERQVTQPKLVASKINEGLVRIDNIHPFEVFVSVYDLTGRCVDKERVRQHSVVELKLNPVNVGFVTVRNADGTILEHLYVF